MYVVLYSTLLRVSVVSRIFCTHRVTMRSLYLNFSPVVFSIIISDHTDAQERVSVEGDHVPTSTTFYYDITDVIPFLHHITRM